MDDERRSVGGPLLAHAGPADHPPERTGGAGPRRQRRRLVAGAVLGVLVVLVFLGLTLNANGRAQDAARRAAAAAVADAAFARVVVDRVESYEAPTRRLRGDAALAGRALEDHLVGDEPPDDALVATVRDLAGSLLTSAEELESLATRPPPTAQPGVDPVVTRAVMTALEQLRIESRALVDEARTIVPTTTEWSAAVTDLDAALAAHARVVADRRGTSDPGLLAAGWRSERATLDALAVQAEATARVPGLGPWAEAHAAYARGTSAFVDEAVPLLDRGDVERYNRLYLATFGDDDPFGFQASARDGAVAALADSPLLELARLEERATIVLESVDAVERTVADGFDDDR